MNWKITLSPITVEMRTMTIIEHTDQSQLRNWVNQAIEIKGEILGGTFFKKKLNQQTYKLLSNLELKNQYR